MIASNSSQIKTEIDKLCNFLINLVLINAKLKITQATQKADD